MKLKDVIQVAKYIAPHAASQFDGVRTLRELEIVARYVGGQLSLPAVGGGHAPVSQSFSVELIDCGSDKIGAIKAVREITTMGLKEAKDLCDRSQAVGMQTVITNVTLEVAHRAAAKLREVGAEVVVR